MNNGLDDMILTTTPTIVKPYDYHLSFPFLPPSSNHVYIRGNNGRVFMTKQGKEFKKTISTMCLSMKPLDGDVEIETYFTFPDKRRRDSSNLEKLLYDALEGYCYHDDKQIAVKHVSRIYGDTALTRIYIRGNSQNVL